MILTALAILGIAAGLVPLIQRDLRRAVRRQRLRVWLRVWLRSNPKALDLQRRINAMQHQIAAAMLPAMRDAVRAAADMEKAMAQVAATIRGDR